MEVLSSYMSSDQSDARVLHLNDEMKEKVRQNVFFYLRNYWGFLIGMVIAIGSAGLLLGGFTVLLTYLLMGEGMEMIPAMIIGFFTVSVLGAVSGTVALYRGLMSFLKASL